MISAMQGHALGGGLAFGCFADIIVMGVECIYSANFMKYGFTPGMGATYIIPRKFGEVLGTEMLLTAKNYYGSELKERGASAKIQFLSTFGSKRRWFDVCNATPVISAFNSY